MEKRTLIIGGGVAAVAVVGFLFLRSRGAAPAQEEGGDDSGVLGGSTLLFTPPAPLSAPGADDWDTGAGGMATGGSTELVAALTRQDQNATQLGFASLLEGLGQSIIPQVADNLGWRFSANFVPGENGAFGLDTMLIKGRGVLTGGIVTPDYKAPGAPDVRSTSVFDSTPQTVGAASSGGAPASALLSTSAGRSALVDERWRRWQRGNP